MNFKEASDRLMAEGLTAVDIAEAFGLAPQTVRLMRLDPDSPHYRRPPDDWRERLASYAESRTDVLRALAGQIREGKG